jgi:hypothetical protein
MAKRPRERWSIEYRNIDPGREETVAYKGRQEAMAAALYFIKDAAKSELEDIEWEEGDEAPETLKSILKSVEEEDSDEAVIGWLEYQRDYGPLDREIAIGPSGYVSDMPWELPEA